MTKIKELIKKHKQIIVYVIFGVLTTLVNLISFFVLEYIFGSGGNGYIIYNAIAWAVAVIFAYVTNKLYVFESKSWAPKIVVKESVEFLLARLFSFVVEELGLILMVEILSFGELTFNLKVITLTGASLAKILLSVVVIIMNYFFSKFIIFKRNK